MLYCVHGHWKMKRETDLEALGIHIGCASRQPRHLYRFKRIRIEHIISRAKPVYQSTMEVL